jgi:hypothetical protein
VRLAASLSSLQSIVSMLVSGGWVSCARRCGGKFSSRALHRPRLFSVLFCITKPS